LLQCRASVMWKMDVTWQFEWIGL